MTADESSPWAHSHRFETGGEAAAERRTRAVVALTLAMMVGEIAAGIVFNSMALLADGWHMATHAGALAIAAFAYSFARRHAEDRRFAFGPGRIGALAAFTSAVILGLVALIMAWESGNRLLAPQTIAFEQALAVAALGLAVNLASALLLGGGHSNAHQHDHDHHHHDHNLRAAYLHVIADAFTSVLAIAALLAGKMLGWWWLDPLMGIVGSVVIAKWAWGLLRHSGAVLVDFNHDPEVENEIRAVIEVGADRITDLHLWQVGPGHWAAIVAVLSPAPRPPAHYRERLAVVHELSHVTVEVQTDGTGQ